MGKSDIDSSYIIDNLERAISEGWIQAYYMPIVRSSNGKVCEEEALARWIDPEYGRLTPDRFIPILEANKLIYKLDLKIVDEVLKKMKAQADAGLYVVPISVNLSRIDFDTCDIVEEIHKRVDAAGIIRDKLIIEITENVVASDLEYMKAQIERFQSLGFHVWMDDFGSGYSSLDVLEEINFEHIKFDIKFMEHFEHEKARIMLVELMRMAMALGIRTITEGVETPEQARFLSDIGCNKMQGYHFCRPVSLQDILARYDKGIQIGFENPAESPYYDCMGRINLYDLSVISGTGDETDAHYDESILHRYFDTLPMAVFESDLDGFVLMRCNPAYTKFTKRFLDQIHVGHRFDYKDYTDFTLGSVLSAAVKQAATEGGRVFFRETLSDGSQMRAVACRIVVNSVRNVAACAVVILEIVEPDDVAEINYEQIARALSSDYLYLFYVDLESEDFTEYSHSSVDDSLSAKRVGTDFFAASRRDAGKILHPDDRERFISSFTKDNVLRTIDENGAFLIGYRLLIDSEPVYVNMKGVRIGSHRLIIGVNNVDLQVRLQKAYDRLDEERRVYSRVMALVGDFVCMYIVDPETGSYTEYSSTDKYDALNMSKSGDDFFRDAREESIQVIYPEDVELFRIMFTRDRMIDEISKNGQFMMIYRLIIDDKPEYVNLKATMFEENGRRQIIVGVSFYR
ncbi:MAG: EAL domain-containing protein [Lachnospiraceae bacterium]|nr:EAL domain-containing protein [Lachnospiraceae bacterium]